MNFFAQKRVMEFTSGFFLQLKEQWIEKGNLETQLDLEFLLSSKYNSYLEIRATTQDQTFRELDEKIFTLLSWLIVYLWGEPTLNTEQHPILPFMVNELIRAPSINLQGRPSAVFKHPNGSVLILIQAYGLISPYVQRWATLHAVLYARILETMGIRANCFLYVNYYSMNLIFQELKNTDFRNFDRFLKDFRIAIKEENFDPLDNPPCDICEFQWICNN